MNAQESHYNYRALEVTETKTYLCGDDYGSCTDLVAFTFQPNYKRCGYSKVQHHEVEVLRQVAEFLQHYIGYNSLPTDTGMGYDCTGKAFGGVYKKVHYQTSYDNVAVVLTHSYSFDI